MCCPFLGMSMINEIWILAQVQVEEAGKLRYEATLTIWPFSGEKGGKNQRDEWPGQLRSVVQEAQAGGPYT